MNRWSIINISLPARLVTAFTDTENWMQGGGIGICRTPLQPLAIEFRFHYPLMKTAGSKDTDVNPREFWQPSNLLSLSRIPLAALIWYLLPRSDTASTVAAAGLLILAGVTDGLDGYVARRRAQITPLGAILDPVADKVFAAVLVMSLILYRNFPIWLAGVVVGRDLLILIGGVILSREREVRLPSNLTGKYAFAALAVLIGSYIIRFDFGITLMTVISVVFLAASLLSYGRVFLSVRRGEPTLRFHDRPALRALRLSLVAAVSLVYLVRCYLEVIR